MCGITVQWLTRSPKLWHGYLHLSPRDGTTTFGPAGSAGWETGSYKLRNIRTGLLVFVGVNAIVRRCFAMEVRGLVRATLGKIKYTRRNKIVLTGCGVSSLVIDALCKQAVEENTAVACFYFDFAVQQEQFPDAILGSVLKQVVGGLEEVPGRIAEAFRERGKVIGGQRLQLAGIVEFLQDIASSQPTFICIDALDEYPARHRVKLLNSLNQILERSPGVRIFLTGRQHILGEVEKHLAGRVATRHIKPTKNDIIAFLRAKLNEDTMPDAMNESLEEEIIRKIPETTSEV